MADLPVQPKCANVKMLIWVLSIFIVAGAVMLGVWWSLSLEIDRATYETDHFARMRDLNIVGLTGFLLVGLCSIGLGTAGYYSKADPGVVVYVGILIFLLLCTFPLGMVLFGNLGDRVIYYDESNPWDSNGMYDVGEKVRIHEVWDTRVSSVKVGTIHWDGFNITNAEPEPGYAAAQAMEDILGKKGGDELWYDAGLGSFTISEELTIDEKLSSEIQAEMAIEADETVQGWNTKWEDVQKDAVEWDEILLSEEPSNYEKENVVAAIVEAENWIKAQGTEPEVTEGMTSEDRYKAVFTQGSELKLAALKATITETQAEMIERGVTKQTSQTWAVDKLLTLADKNEPVNMKSWERLITTNDRTGSEQFWQSLTSIRGWPDIYDPALQPLFRVAVGYDAPHVTPGTRRLAAVSEPTELSFCNDQPVSLLQKPLPTTTGEQRCLAPTPNAVDCVDNEPSLLILIGVLCVGLLIYKILYTMCKSLRKTGIHEQFTRLSREVIYVGFELPRRP